MFRMLLIKQNHYKLGPTSMKVGRQHKRVALCPIHNSNGLWLSGISDKVEPIRKVTVQVIVISVVTSLDATDISCTKDNVFITMPSSCTYNDAPTQAEKNKINVVLFFYFSLSIICTALWPTKVDFKSVL